MRLAERHIEKLIPPNKVLLVWQTPDMQSGQPVGDRFVVGEILSEGESTVLKYYENQDVKSAYEKGFRGLTAYPYEPHKEFTGNLIDILSKRLPPATRTDYNEFLKSYRISPTAEGISILSLLAYTSGKIEGDGFSFVHAFENAKAPFDFTFEIAGFRHNEGMKLEQIASLMNKKIMFEEESLNERDKDAVVVTSGGIKLGYVPRGLNTTLKKFISTYKVDSFITKINGTHLKPNVLVYVEIR